ncbi:MAG: condensation domain-containing protein [Burkholderiaceae bacterium]
MKRFDETLASLSDRQKRLLSKWLSSMATPTDKPRQRKQIQAYVMAAGAPSDDALSAQDVKRYLADRLPEYMVPERVEFVESLPRLPNGKLDRGSLAINSALTNSDALAQSTDNDTPRTTIESVLTDIWSDLLQIEPIGLHENFFELGGDSIVSIQMISRAREQGLNLNHSHFLTNVTIAEMAAALDRHDSAQEANTEQRTGVCRPSPIQLWFLNRGLANPAHWNSARALDLGSDVSDSAVREAVVACVEHHDGLRARFYTDADGLAKCQIADEFAVDDYYLTLQGNISDAQLLDALNTAQAKFSLADGSLIVFVHCEASAQRPGRLMVLAHHLLIDNVSWQILLEDLMTALSAADKSADIALPAKTSSFVTWAMRAIEYADSDQCAASLEYWRQPDTSSDVPLDHQVETAITWPAEASASAFQSTLSESLTEKLTTKSLQAYNTQVRDLLVTALGCSLAAWTQNTSVQFDLEGHGREAIDPGLDLSRTVGWFTSFFPLRLTLSNNADHAATIKIVKEALRQLPGNGIDFGMLAYLSSSAAHRESLVSVQKSQVLFNYLGRSRTDSTDSQHDSAIPEQLALRASNNARSHLIEINTEIVNDRLVSTWLYSEDVHRRETIESLASKFSEYLEALIEHCLSTGAGGYTVSDFPDADLDQDDLDNLLDSLR